MKPVFKRVTQFGISNQFYQSQVWMASSYFIHCVHATYIHYITWFKKGSNTECKVAVPMG